MRRKPQNKIIDFDQARRRIQSDRAGLDLPEEYRMVWVSSEKDASHFLSLPFHPYVIFDSFSGNPSCNLQGCKAKTTSRIQRVEQGRVVTKFYCCNHIPSEFLPGF